MRFSTVFGLSLVTMAIASPIVSPVSSPIEGEMESSLEKRGNGATVTWYSGQSLKNPACGGPSPGNNALVAAVLQNGGYAKCGDHITLKYNGHSVRVKVIDYCASGCSGTWFDVTQGAFKHLAGLNSGELHNVQWSKS